MASDKEILEAAGKPFQDRVMTYLTLRHGNEEMFQLVGGDTLGAFPQTSAGAINPPAWSGIREFVTLRHREKGGGFDGHDFVLQQITYGYRGHEEVYKLAFATAQEGVWLKYDIEAASGANLFALVAEAVEARSQKAKENASLAIEEMIDADINQYSFERMMR